MQIPPHWKNKNKFKIYEKYDCLTNFTCRYPYAIGQAYFGEGTGRVWLDEINCNGTEDDLFKCGSTGWGNTNCGHSKDVSILCGL